ncbi:hypothetical protein B0H15DRAFT_803485 [Mycena belliarum]|uniref:Uncharacterized protein n=1 Tax=Mycena belliarum TaxID=1033014 RepID=A0AAD6U1M9_9AGAR|nr:hypothetical protein B0H15DRAFT_803485 [Mycena belliae]
MASTTKRTRGRKTKMSPEQTNFLEGKYDQFDRKRRSGKLQAFWTKMENEWFKRWPEEDALGIVLVPPDEDDPEEPPTMSAEDTLELGAATKARKSQLHHWFNNRNQKLQKQFGVTKASGNLAIKLFRNIRSRSRRLQEVEIYQKRHKTTIDEKVKAALATLSAAQGASDSSSSSTTSDSSSSSSSSDSDSSSTSDVDDSNADGPEGNKGPVKPAGRFKVKEGGTGRKGKADKKRAAALKKKQSEALTIRRQIAQTMLDNEEKAERAIVAKLYREQKGVDTTDVLDMASAERSPEELQAAQDQLEGIVAEFHAGIERMTGFLGVSLFGGPVPNEGGRVQTKAYCSGESPAGLSLAQSIRDFDKVVVAATGEWLGRCFSKEVRRGRALARPTEQSTNEAAAPEALPAAKAKTKPAQKAKTTKKNKPKAPPLHPVEPLLDNGTLLSFNDTHDTEGWYGCIDPALQGGDLANGDTIRHAIFFDNPACLDATGTPFFAVAHVACTGATSFLAVTRTPFLAVARAACTRAVTRTRFLAVTQIPFLAVAHVACTGATSFLAVTRTPFLAVARAACTRAVTGTRFLAVTQIPFLAVACAACTGATSFLAVTQTPFLAVAHAACTGATSCLGVTQAPFLAVACAACTSAVSRTRFLAVTRTPFFAVAHAACTSTVTRTRFLAVTRTPFPTVAHAARTSATSFLAATSAFVPYTASGASTTGTPAHASSPSITHHAFGFPWYTPPVTPNCALASFAPTAHGTIRCTVPTTVGADCRVVAAVIDDVPTVSSDVQASTAPQGLRARKGTWWGTTGTGTGTGTGRGFGPNDGTVIPLDPNAPPLTWENTATAAEKEAVRRGDMARKKAAAEENEAARTAEIARKARYNPDGPHDLFITKGRKRSAEDAGLRLPEGEKRVRKPAASREMPVPLSMRAGQTNADRASAANDDALLKKLNGKRKNDDQGHSEADTGILSMYLLNITRLAKWQAKFIAKTYGEQGKRAACQRRAGGGHSDGTEGPTGTLRRYGWRERQERRVVAGRGRRASDEREAGTAMGQGATGTLRRYGWRERQERQERRGAGSGRAAGSDERRSGCQRRAGGS